MEENELAAPETTEVQQEGDVLDLSAFLAEVIEAPQTEPEVTKPTFFQEESDAISAEDLVQLDEVITELETNVQQKEEEISQANSKLAQANEEMTAIQNLLAEKETSLSDSISKMEKMEEIWNSVINHPEIGKLVEKVARWEEVSISEYALRQIESELDDLPEISGTPQPSEIAVRPSMTQMLSRTPSY